MNAPQHRRQFTLRALFVCMLVASVIALGVSIFSKKVQVVSRRAYCQNNLQNISLALLSYESQYGCFPPAVTVDADGNPMHSWRVLILPYLDQAALYKAYRFDEPWDGPHNRKLHAQMPPVFRCPTAPPGTQETSYLAVLGTNTCWPGSGSRKISEITDGMSNSILLLEAHDSGIHWMEPVDLLADGTTPADNPRTGEGFTAGTHHDEPGFYAAFADGSVHWIRADLDPAVFRLLLNVRDGQPIHDETLYAPGHP